MLFEQGESAPTTNASGPTLASNKLDTWGGQRLKDKVGGRTRGLRTGVVPL